MWNFIFWVPCSLAKDKQTSLVEFLKMWTCTLRMERKKWIYRCKIPSTCGILGKGKMACKITKFMWWWFTCLTRTFWITYDRLQEIIHGQYIWQIKTTKLDCWNRPSTYWDLFPKISMHSKLQLKKSGQRTKPTRRRIPTSHHNLFPTKTWTHWCQWWKLALKLQFQC